MLTVEIEGETYVPRIRFPRPPIGRIYVKGMPFKTIVRHRVP